MQLIYNQTYNKNIHPITLNTFIEHFINIDKSSSAVLIVPTRKYAEYTKKQWIKKYFTQHKKAVGKLHIYNLIDFAALVQNEINIVPKNIYSAPALLIMLEEIMFYLLKYGKLEYYKRCTQGIITKIFDVINGLRKEGISATNMKNELVEQQNISSAEKRFADITNIYFEYEKILTNKTNSKTDETGIFNDIINICSNEEISKQVQGDILNNLSFLDDDSIIYFHDFTEFKLPEAKFVSLFSNTKTPTLVSIDYSKESGPVIDNLPMNIRRLVTNELNTNLIRNNTNELTSHIKKWLFNSDEKLYNSKLLNQITIYETKDRIEEVKNIVKLSVYLNRTQKINFSDICVCSRSSEIYSDLFREYFSESGIAVNITDRYNLSTANPIVNIFSLLDLTAKRWKRTDLDKLSIFSELNNYLTNESEKDNTEYNIKTLISVANNFKIIGGLGKNNWINILKKIEKIKNHPSISIASNTFNKITQLVSFKNKDNFNNYIDKIIEIIKTIKIDENIFNDAKEIIQKNNENSKNQFTIDNFQILEEIEKKAKAIQTFNKLLIELKNIENEKQYSINDFVNKLKTAVQNTKYQLKEKNNLGINITSIEQTRGIPYKVMILCGAIENELPLSFRTDKFLGKELPNSEQIHNDSEKILFYRFLTNNIPLLEDEKMQFFIFYPKTTNKTSAIRSSFIDDLCDIMNENDVKQNIISL